MPEQVSVSYPGDSDTGWIRLSRPETMNAVSPELLAEIDAALDRIEADGASICVIAGSGKAFSAGADLKAVLELSDAETESYIRAGNELMRRLELGPLVTIAAVDGYALGGGTEIALACNLCVASPNASFGLPEVLVGTFPGWGGVDRLARRAPRAIALDMLMSGRRLDPREAQLAGIVSVVADDAEVAATEASARLAKAAPGARMKVRDLVFENADLPLDEAIERTTLAWLDLVRSAERIEGHTAFTENRAPPWFSRGEQQ